MKKNMTINNRKKTIRKSKKYIRGGSEPIIITAKLYPKLFDPKSRKKGTYIADYRINFNTSKLPFTYKDQVEHYMNNLFEYIKQQSSKNIDPNEIKPPIFPHKNIEFKFNPYNYE
jgi:hypothetical protein